MGSKNQAEMASHEEIDKRSLRLAHAIVDRIEQDPSRLHDVRRWDARHSVPGIVDWQVILERPRPEIRAALLDPTEEGQRRRQNTPFVGILTPQERWSIYREALSP